MPQAHNRGISSSSSRERAKSASWAGGEGGGGDGGSVEVEEQAAGDEETGKRRKLTRGSGAGVGGILDTCIGDTILVSPPEMGPWRRSMGSATGQADDVDKDTRESKSKSHGTSISRGGVVLYNKAGVKQVIVAEHATQTMESSKQVNRKSDDGDVETKQGDTEEVNIDEKAEDEDTVGGKKQDTEMGVVTEKQNKTGKRSTNKEGKEQRKCDVHVSEADIAVVEKTVTGCDRNADQSTDGRVSEETIAETAHVSGAHVSAKVVAVPLLSKDRDLGCEGTDAKERKQQSKEISALALQQDADTIEMPSSLVVTGKRRSTPASFFTYNNAGNPTGSKDVAKDSEAVTMLPGQHVGNRGVAGDGAALGAASNKAEQSAVVDASEELSRRRDRQQPDRYDAAPAPRVIKAAQTPPAIAQAAGSGQPGMHERKREGRKGGVKITQATTRKEEMENAIFVDNVNETRAVPRTQKRGGKSDGDVRHAGRTGGVEVGEQSAGDGDAGIRRKSMRGSGAGEGGGSGGRGLVSLPQVGRISKSKADVMDAIIAEHVTETTERGQQVTRSSKHGDVEMEQVDTEEVMNDGKAQDEDMVEEMNEDTEMGVDKKKKDKTGKSENGDVEMEEIDGNDETLPNAQEEEAPPRSTQSTTTLVEETCERIAAEVLTDAAAPTWVQPAPHLLVLADAVASAVLALAPPVLVLIDAAATAVCAGAPASLGRDGSCAEHGELELEETNLRDEALVVLDNEDKVGVEKMVCLEEVVGNAESASVEKDHDDEALVVSVNDEEVEKEKMVCSEYEVGGVDSFSDEKNLVEEALVVSGREEEVGKEKISCSDKEVWKVDYVVEEKNLVDEVMVETGAHGGSCVANAEVIHISICVTNICDKTHSYV